MPASKYIKAVYVMVSIGNTNVNYLNQMYDLKKFCLLRKVKVYYFEDFTSLLHRDLRKAVQYKPVKPGVDKDAYVYPRESLEYEALNPRRKTDTLAMWYALYRIPKKAAHESYDQLAAMGNKKLLDTFNRLRYDDALTGLSADMHNAKSTSYGDKSGEREHLDKLVDAMRKDKQSPKQWVAALREKWYPTTKVTNTKRNSTMKDAVTAATLILARLSEPEQAAAAKIVPPSKWNMVADARYKKYKAFTGMALELTVNGRKLQIFEGDGGRTYIGLIDGKVVSTYAGPYSRSAQTRISTLLQQKASELRTDNT